MNEQQKITNLEQMVSDFKDNDQEKPPEKNGLRDIVDYKRKASKDVSLKSLERIHYL